MISHTPSGRTMFAEVKGEMKGPISRHFEESKAIHPRYPSLYQINTRILLEEKADDLGRPANFDDIPDDKLERLRNLGFDWVYLLGVWQTSPAGLEVCRSLPDLREELLSILPDLKESDICSSCFAIQSYTVHNDFGGNAGLRKFRQRLNENGIRLMLDFVPNHTALDHLWVQERPELYVHGSELDLDREPQNYIRVGSRSGSIILAHGRDPNYPGWSDTLQLNYGHPNLKEEMIAELSKIARLCDGVRCDMAMLLLPEVFRRTWGILPEPFWPDAIQEVRQLYPEWVFMAEAYWGLERELLQQGFDYTYNKELYDLLRKKWAGPIRYYLLQSIDEQKKLVRFMENHDEPRAAAAYPFQVHKGAAIITYLSPGLRFFHQGQFEGRRKRIPVQIKRRPSETVDPHMQEFYCKLLACMRLQISDDSLFQLLEPVPAWEGSCTWQGFVAFTWHGRYGQRLLVVVNYADNRGQCYVRLPFEGLSGRNFQLTDLMSDVRYDRSGDELISPGLYLDMPEWGYHIFKFSLGNFA